MNENKCQKMMGRGAEGGCGTEEKPRTLSKVSTEQTCSRSRGEVEIGFYDQARKALSERCPFDSEEATVSRVSTLPVGLAESLHKYSTNSRKRHKKTGSTDCQVQVRGSNIWVETEDYFRPVGLNDIEVLFEKSSFGSLATHSFFTIPPAKDTVQENVTSVATVSGDGCIEPVEAGSNPQSSVVQVEKGIEEQPMDIDRTDANAGQVEGTEANVCNVDRVEANVGIFDRAEANVCNMDQAEAEVGNVARAEWNVDNLDLAEANIDNGSPLKEIENSLALAPSSPARSSGLEWLLASRNKILLTSERPSKKRKLFGSDAGLERLRIVSPSEGQVSPVCHVCCLGDIPEHSNALLVCDSCKVAVHQICYGVQELSIGLWLCSWCKYCRETGSEVLSTPCFLCPKAGGALKPVAKETAERKSSVSAKFVHLFCSQWVPEVYVEDLTKMEPIMNVGGIKETRRKLVCNICKVKYGACLRCTHGTCRTSFHPICAREAGQRMEIWGKTGSDIVELRAFCSKHSEFQDISTQQSNGHPFGSVGCDSSVSKNIPVKLMVNKPHKLKLGLKNGGKNTVLVPTSDTISNKSGNSEVSSEEGTSVPASNIRTESECHDAQSSVSLETLDGVDKKKTIVGNTSSRFNASDSHDFVRVLKKLVDRGKACLGDVALDIGISSDLLAATLAGDQPSSLPDLHCRIVKWLIDHAHMGNSQCGSNSAKFVRARTAGIDGPNALVVEGGDNSKAGHVKSIPPRKSTSNLKILNDNKVVCSSNGRNVQLEDIAKRMGEVDVDSLVPSGGTNKSGYGSCYFDGSSPLKENNDKEKVPSEPSGYEDFGSSVEKSVQREVELANGNFSGNGQENALEDSVQQCPISSFDGVASVVPDLLTVEPASCSYIHPFIRRRLIQFQNGALAKQENICHDSNDHSSSISTLKLEQLAEAKKMEILDLSPEDEVEGELVYFQNKLIEHAVTSRRYCDDLIFRVIKALPQELDAERNQRWNDVLVNQYTCGLREAKKQGRKERRHKEAQAVLAAATAAAAASSRISSFRKDAHDEAAQEASAVSVRTSPSFQQTSRAKEGIPRLAVARVSSEKPSNVFQLKSFLSEHQQLCDICRRFETMLNPIYVCCSCKVAVHFGCYRGVKDHIGPWYCELCEELLPFRSPRSLPLHSREKSAVVQCGLCGGTTGAFRKSTDGQWVHAFCAEWLLESTFRRGQPNLVEGMEAILKGRDVCYICSRKIGVCIKCNYGNCQSIFHPLCARNAGFYMHVKTGGNKLQHKGYCDRHSLEQREKAASQQHGPEELRAVKQIRVELERVRLLCERIIKREKVKRELIICSHNILASKRDSVAFSMLVRSPFFLPDVSSESATTSLRGHVDDNKSCSEPMQRSDDITVDSAVSGKHGGMLSVQMDTDQKTDDSSTSQHMGTRNPPSRPPFSGKQLPQRPASFSSRNLTDDEERRSKSRKYTETFQKELVMTSDQASVQNQRLPKGFAYVPIVCLPKEKPAVCERGSHESVEPDG